MTTRPGFFWLLRTTTSLVVSGRMSRRALATAFKFDGRRLERRWPFIPKAERHAFNLDITDVLEFQRARSGDFTALIVGAYDGVANDPAGAFVRQHDCKAVFVEPQPAPFARLQKVMAAANHVQLINAAVDAVAGSRPLYTLAPTGHDLPPWTEQLASFDRNHLLKHEDRAPGLSAHIVTLDVPTLTFADLMRSASFARVDLLQIDAEGMDAQLLSWFPFEQTKPGIVHYENAHMSVAEHQAIRRRLHALGYAFFEDHGALDDLAVLL